MRVTQNFRQRKKSTRRCSKRSSTSTRTRHCCAIRKVRLRLYEAVTRILLQKRDYTRLEEYLRDLKEFNETKPSTAATTTRSCRCWSSSSIRCSRTARAQESLHYAAIPSYPPVEEQPEVPHGKYLFFHYKRAGHQLFETDMDNAIAIPQEMKATNASARHRSTRCSVPQPGGSSASTAPSSDNPSANPAALYLLDAYRDRRSFPVIQDRHRRADDPLANCKTKNCSNGNYAKRKRISATHHQTPVSV